MKSHMQSLKRLLWLSSLAFSLPFITSAQPPNPNPGHGKISQDAAKSDPNSVIPVIIQYRQDPGAAQDTEVAQLGGATSKTLHSIHAKAALLPASQLGTLAADPNVSYVSIDRPVHPREAVSVTAPDYTYQPINAPSAWTNGYIGTGIGVAVIDSGITVVNDLQNSAGVQLPGTPAIPAQPAVPGSHGRVVYSATFVANTKDGNDQLGHGTHVAGLIAGNGKNSTGNPYKLSFYGIAPNANLVDLRALDATGAGTDSSVIAAIEQAIALKNQYNIRVINLSLGRPIWESYTQDPLCQAVEQAWKAGIVVVVAAGNDGRDLAVNSMGYGTIEAPGNDPYVLTVGAMRTMETPAIGDDLIASYSSKGPSFIDNVAKPDIVAPGNLVISLKFPNDALAVENPTFVTPNGFYRSNGNTTQVSNDYFPLSGTSMATAVTSGAVADLLQAYPQLTPDQVKALLMTSANRSYFPAGSSVFDPATGLTYYAQYDMLTRGAGYLDLAAALQAVSTTPVPSGTAMSPLVQYDPTSNDAYLVADQTALWGKT
ncbi:MAG: S8 family peptidase, partial [Acidobacteriaceae bacterium]